MKEIDQPQRIAFFDRCGVKDVCAGQFHTMALTPDNELYVWGKGHVGQLGLRNAGSKGEPTRVNIAESSEAVLDVSGNQIL